MRSFSRPNTGAALRQGYKAGVVWRAFEDQSLSASALLDYITCFYDPGLTCPYVISLATAVALDQHGSEELKARFLPQLLRRDDTVWQGATWMTEIKGGSDLGANVETVARPAGGRWLLTGDKYFASNAGADLAVVAARPEGAPHNVRGLALFLLPKRRENGELNYTIRRLKDKVATRSVPTGEIELRDSEAWLLGSTGPWRASDSGSAEPLARHQCARQRGHRAARPGRIGGLRRPAHRFRQTGLRSPADAQTVRRTHRDIAGRASRWAGKASCG